jgi:signal transduction histidine kinase/ligand-binding sensor domain-containing protein/DNA-binding response OmpR family regulator
MNIKTRFLLAMVLLVGQVSAGAQKLLDFDGLSIEDGFSSSKAISILQDRKGYIWVGTWNGLTRFDGYRTEVFKPWHHDSTTISNKEIVSLCEDHQGYIWIGTSDGLNRLDPETGTVRIYPFDSRIMVVYEDRHHQIWVGTWSHGLFLLDAETGQTKSHLPYETISDVHEDSDGEFWVATYSGLVNLNRQTGGFIRFMPNAANVNSSINQTVVTQIAETPDGTLWVGVWDGGINKIVDRQDKSRIRFEHYTVQKRAGSIVANDVYRLLCDQFGNLWIGTWSGGLSLLEPDQQKKSPSEAVFSSYVNEIANPYSISGNNITALLVDRSGMLWVGSSKIDRANVVQTGLKRVNTSRFAQGVYHQNEVRCLSVNDNGRLWIGTTDVVKHFQQFGDEYLFERDINRVRYSYKGISYLASSVLALSDQPDGLWVGTDDAGLVFFPASELAKPGQPSFVFWNTSTPVALPSNKINKVVKSQHYAHTYWLGTTHSGLARFEYQNGVASVSTYGAGGGVNQLTDNNIRAVIEDRHGFVWIGTQKGLNRLNPKNGQVRQFYYNTRDKSTINDNVINVVLEDNQGDIWIATNSGLNRLIQTQSPEGNDIFTFKSYPNLPYLNNEVITNMVDDANGHLWIGLYLGMVSFNRDSETIVGEYFIKEYGRLGLERNAAGVDNDGRVLLGGINGFLYFHPDRLNLNSIAPKAVITDLLIFDKPVTSQTQSGKRTVLDKSISYTSEITLAYSDNVFTFVFSAMDFKSPNKNKYAYFLDGFDRQWNDVGTRNTATYTGIPHGEYLFKVKACNSDGVWSTETTDIRVVILPPWWRTWPAYLLYSLIMLGLLYVFKQYATVQVRHRNLLAMERLNFEKEHELNELKSQFFTNITHEFRTPLTLILGPSNELLANKELPPFVAKQAQLIQKSAQRLLRLVNQLMEFRKVENEKMHISLKRVDVVPLIKEACEAFLNMAESRNIRFDLMLKPNSLHAVVDVDKVEKIVFNLLSNAFKFTEDGGRIVASLDWCENGASSFYFEVEDSGIGIAKDKQGLVFNRFYQVNQDNNQSTGGIGLYLSRAFAELHGGTIELESELGKGSVFKVTLPVDGSLGDGGLVEALLPAEAGSAPVEGVISSPEQTDAEVNQPVENNELPHLLIVEDDHDMNDFIATGLDGDFNVSTCFNGREGLDQARKLLPDLIVSDIMMPEMDGFDLCKHLRKDINTSHIPVVFLTAKTMKDDEIKGLKLGAVDYITKPFDLTTLKLKLKNILQTKQHIQEKLRTNMLLEPEEIELTSLDETFLKDIVDAVTKNLDNPTFDVELLSKEVGMSSNQVYRKIKSLTGQTAKEFIRSQRLKTSASMLLQKKRSISEIIYMVGFSSPSYFARCFKDQFGCTPSEFIDKNS